MLGVRLRPSRIDASKGALEELEASKAECRDSGEASRSYRELRYRTLDSWSCERRVVGKPEWLPGPRGSNPRFVVSNIADDDIEARALYEDLYCARGDMENRIKEQQLDLFADRTPAHVMRANQLRAYFSAFAGALMQVIRTFGLKGTELEGSGRYDPHSAAQDRRLHQGDDAQDPGLALLGLPVAQTLQAGRPQPRGHRRTAVTRISTRVTPPRLRLRLGWVHPRRGGAWRYALQPRFTHICLVKSPAQSSIRRLPHSPPTNRGLISPPELPKHEIHPLSTRGDGSGLANPALSWTSTNPSAVTVSPGGVAVAAGTGQATITASSGRATGSTSATVSLVPRSMLKVSGDAQRGRAGSPLPASVVTEVRDPGGAPIPGAAVAWTISGDDGVITSSLDQTDGAGRASARWTLGGAEGSQAVTARAGPVDIVFTAEAIPPLEASMSPPSARIQVADSADFALAISGGDPGETVSWTCTSPDTGVVYVQPTAIGCRVTGLAEGNATVSATVARGADRATAAAALEVGELVGAVRITGIEPTVLIEGQDATIHGTGFSAVASENRVTIGGLAARISSAAATRLTLTVPRAACLPPRQTLLFVSNSSTTASRSAGITPPPEDVDLPVEWFRYTAAGTGCLHLPGSAGGGEYLIGVASTSELPSSLTPVSLSGTPEDRSVVATSPAAVARPEPGPGPSAPGRASPAGPGLRLPLGGSRRSPLSRNGLPGGGRPKRG